MSIIKAYTLPHPPLAVPAVGRGKEKDIPGTISAFDEVGKEIANIQPETIIYITPHSILYSDHFHISPGGKARGDLSRFGAPDVTFEVDYDSELAQEIERVAVSSDLSAGTQGERDALLDHGVTVPMWYINKYYDNYKALRISQSGMSACEHYLFGQIIAKAVTGLDRKVVVIASADLSHRLKDGGAYDYSPDGAKFDKAVIEALDSGDFLKLLKIPETLRENAGECGYNSLMIMAGVFDCMEIETKLLSYEGFFGVGYAISSVLPLSLNPLQCRLEQYLEFTLQESDKSRNLEDDYQKLARSSLEHVITTGDKLPVPNGLSSELLGKRAGVFVSLHKNGRLRGCIGTIAPTTNSVAEEIIQNAVSAGLSDTRFSPVSKEELMYLSYKVDVLSAPEKINSPQELDVKRYGVIVTSGMRRGLLLPNLDGVDRVEDQIEIAKNKAGISANDEVRLERFEVIRHG